jgi:hypothetical protein
LTIQPAQRGQTQALCADMKTRELYSANRYFEVPKGWIQRLLFGKDQKKLALDKEGYKWVGS